MIRLFYAALFLRCVFQQISAQGVTISGTVTIESDQLPLAYTNSELKSSTILLNVMTPTAMREL